MSEHFLCECRKIIGYFPKCDVLFAWYHDPLAESDDLNKPSNIGTLLCIL